MGTLGTWAEGSQHLHRALIAVLQDEPQLIALERGVAVALLIQGLPAVPHKHVRMHAHDRGVSQRLSQRRLCRDPILLQPDLVHLIDDLAMAQSPHQYCSC